MRAAVEVVSEDVGDESVATAEGLTENERETLRQLDAAVVEAVEKSPRDRREFLYRELRAVLRTREIQASLEPRI